jgi:hypothetical protein
MSEPVKRVRYFDHQLIRAGDLSLDQTYHRRMRELQNRLMYRWGIGEGLQVVAAGTDAVTVGPGVAFDRDGHQILLADPVMLKLADLQLADTARPG